MKVTKAQAKEFYRDVCGAYNGDANKTCQGIASAEHIAETMNISPNMVDEFCHAMVQYEITERQGGGYVIQKGGETMRKIYRPLTKDQKERGVIFSSTLSKARTELVGDTIHEVFATDADKYTTIERLKDDKFFNGSPWKYNIIRQ